MSWASLGVWLWMPFVKETWRKARNAWKRWMRYTLNCWRWTKRTCLCLDRKKNDVARRIIETTRGDITQEVRRKSLEEYLKRFEQAQLKGRTPRKGKT